MFVSPKPDMELRWLSHRTKGAALENTVRTRHRHKVLRVAHTLLEFLERS